MIVKQHYLQFSTQMKRLLLLLVFPLVMGSCDLQSISQAALSSTDVSNGLKAALNLGVDAASRTLTNPSAYGGNVLVNNLLPPNAVKVLNTARQLGFGSYVDKVTGKLNTAAINTVKQAAPIFKNSIRQMNFQDAWGILRGGSGAGTNYLRRTASTQLNRSINTQVQSVFRSLGIKSNLLANFGVSNNPMLSALNVDLAQPLTTLVSNQIFKSIETQENKIRSDIRARPTVLLQRVFAAASVGK